jgi:hypothetical protein
MNLIMKAVAGSHLYGTDTPASDRDWKGVALPTWEQVALGQIPKQMAHLSTNSSSSKNSAEDVDVEIFSIHEFIKLALQGQTVAFDMLHTPVEYQTVRSQIWDDLIANRHHFYSRNIHAFIGYARGQATKYGVKGSRLNDAKAVMEWLIEQTLTKHHSARILECDLKTFPVGEHIRWHVGAYVPVLPPQENDVRQFSGTDMVEVCSRKILLNSSLGYAYDMVKIWHDSYGERAKKAATDGGVDWKAISHAFRVTYEAKELFEIGTITFPRPERAFLLNIKLGKMRYDHIGPMLDDLIDEVEKLRDTTLLPVSPNKEFWDEWLINVIKHSVVPSGIYGSGYSQRQ